MSKFSLISDTYGEKPLNGENDIYIRSVTGLGTQLNTTFSDLSKGFFFNAYSTDSQMSINGTLVFASLTPDSDYSSLMDWIMKADAAEDLMIAYQVRDGGTVYKRKVKVRSVAKSELKKADRLSSDVSFYVLTPWFTTEVFEGTSSTIIDGHYGYDITAKGQLPSAFRITITNTYASGLQAILSGTGVSGRVKFTPSHSTSDVIIISTIPNDFHITKNGADAISEIDISEDEFQPFILPSGATGRFTTTNGSYSVEVFHYWRTI